MPDDKNNELKSPVHRLSKEPKTDEEIKVFIEDSWDWLRRSRTGLERQIKESLHFLSGNQWIKHLPYNNTFDKHTLDNWKPTPVTNYLVRSYDRLIDLFVSGKMQPSIEPASRSQDDIEAARAATHALHSEFNRLKTELNVYAPAAGWLILAGTAVIYAGWDARKGHTIRKPKTSLSFNEATKEVMMCPSCGTDYPRAVAPERCPTCPQHPFLEPVTLPLQDEAGQPAGDYVEEIARDKKGYPLYNEFSVGQIEEKVINVLNWYPQPVAEWKDCRYVMEIDPMDTDKIKDLFGSKSKKVVAEKLEYESWTGSYSNVDEGLNTSDNREDKALVKFFRHIPDHRFKDGCLAIVAGDVVLYKGPLDSCDDRLPYAVAKYRDLPGVFWGASAFTDMIPLQKRINAIDSHIVLNRKQMVANQWLIPSGSGVSHIDGREGLIIEYNPHTTGGYKPERLPGAPVSQQIIQERQTALQDMDAIGGASEIIQGGLPEGASGLETGAAVEFLQEQAFKRFGLAIKRWRHALEDHEHRKLKNIHKYWKEERLARVLGDNKETEVYHLTGADIHGAEDMVMKVGIGADYSMVAQRQKILEATKMGILGDIRSATVRGRILEQLGIEGFDVEYVKDAKKARRLLNGILDNKSEEDLPVIYGPPIDNPQIHLEILKEYALTAEFDGQSQEIKDRILEKVQVYYQFIQQQQQQATQAAQAAKGAPRQSQQAMAAAGAEGSQQPPQTQAVGG